MDVRMIETDRSRDDSQSTKAGAATGTPAYMPPEQAEGKLGEISARPDVYSLGAILYKILTGRVPYNAPNVWFLLMAVVKGELKASSEVANNRIPDELEEICLRALSAKPEDRYADASEMAEESGAWLDGAKRREKALALVQAARNARLEGEEMLRCVEVLRGEDEVSNECYVPVGWFWAGGDPDAFDSWPRRPFWADAFVMQRFPVTSHEYLVFLDDLVVQGREDEALQHVPRGKGGTVGELGAMIYGRDAQDRFELRPDAEGDVWLPQWPVCMIDWYGAKAYATWQASRDCKGWRLMMEQEFEKAARGVDGRFYPWGDHLDPSSCCMKDSHQSQPLPSVVESYPVDVSVYGVRGLGGSMRDWCEGVYAPDAPVSTLVQTPALDQRYLNGGIFRVLWGGSWHSTAFCCRAASRNRVVPSLRIADFSVRLTRSYERCQLFPT